VPFSFGEDEVNLDDSIMASCSIIKGDSPLRIWWRFYEINDALGYNLTTNDGVVVTKPSQKISILAIDAVKARHRGSYSCFAQNRAGISQFSAHLAVNGLSFSSQTFKI
jgi:Down syndrome cell adhesion molecule-like protein 1